MKPAGIKIAIVVLLVGALLVGLNWLREKVAAENEVRALVQSCMRAVEGKQVDTLVDAMSEDFKGPGNVPREGIKSLITFLVQKHPEMVAVFSQEQSVTLGDQEQADFSGTFVFARTKAKSVDALSAADIMSTYRIDAKLKKTGGKWLFVSANSRQL